MNSDVDAAIHLIASQLGLRGDQLIGDTTGTLKPIPTFGEYIPRLKASLPATTAKNYLSYLRIIENAWGSRHLNDPTTTDVNQLVQEHRRNAQVRSNSRDGVGAAAHLIAAFRCIYLHAEFDGLISSISNPARNARKPRRPRSPRHALTREQVVEMGHIAATTGNDTELDALIIRLHIESACRRGGALGLEIPDLDPDNCLITLREKGGTIRFQPISPLLMRKLLEHIDKRRGPDATSKVLRYRNGRPITISRYNTLTARIRKHLPWAQRLRISIHWVRHATLTYVERQFNEATARAYAGHAEPGGTGATPVYTSASLTEVAEALVALTGHPHPLARQAPDPLAPADDPMGVRSAVRASF